jgi:CDP-glucose 4,6-dehydratase
VNGATAFDWQERPVLVTGATGLLGSWLTSALLDRGATVVALVRDEDPGSRLFAEGIGRRCRVVSGDLVDVSDCARAINDHDVEVIFHLGAQTLVGPALRDPLACFESNIRGTYNLLEAARRLSSLVKTVVVASSDKAYGESDTLPYTEDMPLRGQHPYDVSKSCADLLSSTYARTYGMNVTIARCGNIYGGGDLNWSRIVPGTIRWLLAGERPILRSDGTSVRDYVYVRDVVDAYISLAEQSARSEIGGEAFNFSPESRATVLEIVQKIARLMNVVTEPVVLATSRSEIEAQTLDASKAKRLLGWSARWSLDDGLRETIDWYRAHLTAGRC